MALTTEQYEKIIHFLDAEMTLAEMDTFEKELDANPSMREQLNFEQSMRDAFMENKREESTPIDKTKRLWVYLAVAASILGIILLGALYQSKKLSITDTVVRHDTLVGKKDSTISVAKNNNSQTKDSLFEGLFKHYFFKDKPPENAPILLAEALTNYDNGQYDAIQNLNFSQIPETRGEEDSVNNKENILLLGHYYKGISYLETNNCKLAIKNLDWVIAYSQSDGLKAKAEWYLALGYLKDKQPEETNKALMVVTENSTDKPLKELAKELMDTLQK